MHLKDPTLLRTQAFVNGEWVNAASGATHDVLNPATREKLGTGQIGRWRNATSFDI